MTSKLTPLRRRKRAQKVQYLLYVRPRSATHPRFRKWPKGMWAGVTAGGQGWAYLEGDKMSAVEAVTAQNVFKDCYGAGFEFKTEKVK